MGRFATSMEIARDSWGVLKREKELTAIPVMSFVATTATLAAVGAGVWFSLDTSNPAPTAATSTGTATEVAVTPLAVTVGILGYLLVSIVVTFFTAAMVAGAHQALTGGSTTLGQAFGGAGRRIGPIVGWALLTGTVGLVLQGIQDRAGPFGDIIARLVGAAWNIVSWFAIPIVIVEGTGPITALKTSAQLFKKTWGENIIGQAGLGLLGLLIVVPTVVVCGLIAMAIPALGIVLGVVLVGSAIVILSALSAIFRTALYLYASEGTIAQGYSPDTMANAFRPKTGRLGR